MLKNRRLRLQTLFEQNKLDAFLFTDLNNIRYLCGFSGSEGALLVGREQSWFLCDSRYTAQAAEEVHSAEIRECGAARLDVIMTLAADNKISRLGFEASHLSVSVYRKMAEKLGAVELVEITSGLDTLRSCKDSSEIERLSGVAELASNALQQTLPMITPGISEIELAFALELAIRRNGGEDKSFDFIVASGLRGAMPHGRASDKLIQVGELVTIDFGAKKCGYNSDETVTVSCGSPNDEQRKIHAIVKAAHDYAIDAVKPGVSCKSLDAVARDFIISKGYGDFFGHGLGHGVGLEIHEAPTLSPRSSAVLDEGMVITIEPGIYIDGFGGVRIEDTVVVTNNGCRVITKADKHLLVL